MFTNVSKDKPLHTENQQVNIIHFSWLNEYKDVAWGNNLTSKQSRGLLENTKKKEIEKSQKPVILYVCKGINYQMDAIYTR